MKIGFQWPVNRLSLFICNEAKGLEHNIEREDSVVGDLKVSLALTVVLRNNRRNGLGTKGRRRKKQSGDRAQDQTKLHRTSHFSALAQLNGLRLNEQRASIGSRRQARSRRIN